MNRKPLLLALIAFGCLMAWGSAAYAQEDIASESDSYLKITCADTPAPEPATDTITPIADPDQTSVDCTITTNYIASPAASEFHLLSSPPLEGQDTSPSAIGTELTDKNTSLAANGSVLSAHAESENQGIDLNVAQSDINQPMVMTVIVDQPDDASAETPAVQPDTADTLTFTATTL